MSAIIYFHPTLSPVHAARLAFMLGWQIRTNARGRPFLLPPAVEPVRCRDCRHKIAGAHSYSLEDAVCCGLDGLARVDWLDRECARFEAEP